MQILVFNQKYVETAHTLEIRTGLKIQKGEWKPERGGAYIIYGAEKEVDNLLQIKKDLGCIFIIMNFLSLDEIKDTKYGKLLRQNICLEQDIELVKEFTDNQQIPSQMIVHEAFQNKNDGERPIDFIYYETTELKHLFIDPSIKSVDFKDKINYSVNQLTSFLVKAKTYISYKQNDWVNINKALASGCKVISCMESEAMMELYDPYVTFQGEINLDCVVIEPDYDQFQKTVITYSLNKYLYIVKQIYGEVKKTNIDSPTGEAENCRIGDNGEQAKEKEQ